MEYKAGKKKDLDRDGLCSEQVRVAEGLDRLLPPLHQLEDNYPFTAHLHTSTQWILMLPNPDLDLSSRKIPNPSISLKKTPWATY